MGLGFTILYLVLLPLNIWSLLNGLETNNDFSVMCGLVGIIFCAFGLTYQASRW